MSKRTLDETIKHCLEVAERQEISADDKEMYSEILGEDYKGFEEGCRECAAEHRQLAEWLTELKQWRKVYGVCPSCEMYIPECKEGYNAQIAEYKRLLKAAVEDFAHMDSHIYECDGMCDTCSLNGGRDNCLVWRYADEALELIGDKLE